VLTAARIKRRGDILLGKIVPGRPPHSFVRFSDMMSRTAYDDEGFSYRLPDAVKDTESTPW